MKVHTRTVLLIVGLLVVATAAWASISTDYDHKVRFASFKAYSWEKVQTANSLWDERVKSAIDAQLAVQSVRKAA